MSRMDSDIEHAFLRRAFPAIEIEASKVDNDIATYVEAQVEQVFQVNHLTLTNPALQKKISSVLTMKASGMYILQLNIIYTKSNQDNIGFCGFNCN